MSLENWLSEDKIKPHRANPEEIEKLFRVIDRDIADAEIDAVSADRRFATAYNAALQLATVALLARGFRVNAAKGHHYVTISSLPLTMGAQFTERMKYLNLCRQTRNQTDYDQAGVTGEGEVEELLTEVAHLRQDVLNWLRQEYPGLLP